jgi:SAM-dependent methyltransferase
MPLRFYEIAEKDHRILNPFTDEKLMLLGEVCRLEPKMRQLDLACGKGEMLCRWAERFGIEGTGVDISSVFEDAARKRADELNVASQTEFIREDAAKFQAVPDSYDIVSCIGANWIGGGTRGTLELIKGKGLKFSPDSLILMGEIFWREEPSDGALSGMGVQRGEWAVGLEQIRTSSVRLGRVRAAVEIADSARNKARNPCLKLCEDNVPFFLPTFESITFGFCCRFLAPKVTIWV